MLKFISASLLLSLIGISTSQAQFSRVDKYTVTPFTGTWDSLRVANATVMPYSLGPNPGPNDGIYSIPLPFDFIYDGQVLSAGTMISVGANGAISLRNAPIPKEQQIGDIEYEALIAPFNGEIKQGTDAKTNPNPDTVGMYQVTGDEGNRVLTIEYRAFHLRGGGNNTGQVDTLASMQVKLYEHGGVIEFLYRDHGLVLPSKFPEPQLECIGLNGFLTPSFVYNRYAADTRTIPATDLRWTPTAASVDPVKHEAFSISPNPASDHVSIKLSADETMKQVIAIDGLGRMTELKFDGDRVEVAKLVSGKYLLKIETNSGSYSRPLLIVR